MSFLFLLEINRIKETARNIMMAQIKNGSPMIWANHPETVDPDTTPNEKNA